MSFLIKKFLSTRIFSVKQEYVSCDREECLLRKTQSLAHEIESFVKRHGESNVWENITVLQNKGYAYMPVF